jgi:site-specific DNA-methyltransferase (adenine-specific)
MSCDRKIGPFDCCSVVQGDCLELMKLLPDGCVDAVITDPPYGVNMVKNTSRIQGSKSPAFADIEGDDRPFDPSVWLNFPTAVLFGANHYADKIPLGTWLVWDKRDNSGFSMFADGEMAWMNKRHGVRIKSHFERGLFRPEGRAFHPTQKPVAVMMWCIELAGFPQMILDPYAGSGSTLVAAKKLGRHFLGFEISPEYCEIARKRIAAVEAQPTLFEPKPEQKELGL